MKTIDIHTKLVNGYLALLKNLSPTNKLDLIVKLTKSVQADMAANKNSFEKSFGAWQGDESAVELAESIRNSRKFYRSTEQL